MSDQRELEMTTFQDLVAPMDVTTFMSEVYGRRPVHLSGAETMRPHRRDLMDWAGFGALLQLRSHWVEPNLKLVMDGRPVLSEHYCDTVDTLAGPTRRASIEKVQVFMGLGASVVANQAQEVSPALADVCDALSEQFLASTETNIYCSYGGVQAFGTHYDLHEVFAVQVEGRKRWRLYANRAETPLTPPAFTDAAQVQLNAERGALLFEAEMVPGDVLYIPRGWYHDALATSDASLHLTFSVTPMNGRRLMQLLETAALRDASLRGDLPDHRIEEGEPLNAAINAFADRLATLMRSPGFAVEVAAEQRRRYSPKRKIDLPTPKRPRFYRTTERPARVVRHPGGTRLETGAGSATVGLMTEVAEWIISRPAFSIEEVAARYPQFRMDEIDPLVAAMVELKLAKAHEE